MGTLSIANCDQATKEGVGKMNHPRFGLASLSIIASLLAAALGCTNKEPQGAANRGLQAEKPSSVDRAIVNDTQQIQLEPNDAESFYRRGLAYGQKREPGQAIADLSDAIRRQPNLAEAFYNRGIAYEQVGEMDKSKEDHARAKQLGYAPK